MPVSIRPATAADLPAVAAITNPYIERTAIHFGYQPITAAELHGVWAAGRARYPWLVAERGGGVVGYAKAGEWRSREAYRWTTEVALYIDAAHHRVGVGRALYQALLTAVAAAGFRSAIGVIALPNAASVALHRAFGFEHAGTVREAGYKHGAWHDVAFYQRRLRTDAAPPVEPAWDPQNGAA